MSTHAGVRRRNSKQIARVPSSQNDAKEKYRPTPQDSSTLLVCIALTVGLYVLVVELVRTRALRFSGKVDDVNGLSFSSTRALNHIRKMGVWKREVNTPELDAALEYIRTELDASIPIAAANGLVLEVEVFTASGNFPCSLGQGAPVAISYSDIQSVVARLRPSSSSESTKDSLLVNAHVDSAWDGAGVSDNLAGVAIAMELVTSIAEYDPEKHGNQSVLNRPVVFLFNAAEEPLLAGAHGFMTGHRWARTIAAHINIESMGSGNMYVLFQLGPKNAWLADAYSSAVRLPWASGAANDLFASGVIPAETDFRIFKEFGIPGYDFALIDNGYVYHTGYDDLQHFSEHAVHTGGKAVFLPLVLELAGSADAIGQFLSNGGTSAAKRPHMMNETHTFQGESVTFLDLLGSIFISYRPRYRTALNLGALALLAALFALERARDAASSSTTLRLRMAASYVMALIAGFVGAVAFAQILVILRRPLAWFGSVYSAYAVYVPPFMLTASWVLERTLPNVLASTAAVDAMIHAIAVLIAIVLGVAHYIGLGAAYLPLLMLTPFIAGVAGLLPRGVLPLFAVLQISMVITTAGYAHSILGSILSLLGRAGTTPSDLVCALLISGVGTALLLPAFAPVAASNPKALYIIRRFAVVGIGMVAWVVTLRPLQNAGVYSTLAPKRIVGVHFHAPQADPPSVLALVELDRIPVDDSSMAAGVKHVTEFRQLDQPPVFGTPSTGLDEFVHPLREFFGKWKVYAVGQAPPLDVPTAKVTSVHDEEDLVNVTIVIHARNSMQLSMRLAEDSNIVDWSLDAPLSKQGTWVRHVGRGNGADQLEFSVLVRKNDSGVRHPVTFAVSSARRPSAAGVSSAVLQALYFSEWIAPVQAMVTCATFEL